MNLGENNNFFRESFRGFNKEDVAEYIAKLSKDYSANEEKYKEHIQKLTSELKDRTDESGNIPPEVENRLAQLDEIEQKHKSEVGRLVNELNEKDSAISELRTQLETARSQSNENAAASLQDSAEIIKYQELIGNLSREIEQLREESEKSEAEYNKLSESLQSVQSSQSDQSILFEQFEQNAETISRLSTQLSETEAEYDSLKEKTYELEREYDALKAENDALERERDALKAKAEEEERQQTVPATSDEQRIYESITADLGGIIYSAKKAAEEISSKAEAEAEELIGRARFEADAIIGNANAKKAAILDESMKSMSEFREKYGFVKKEYEAMTRKYKEISDNYMFHMSEIETAINVIYDTVSR